MITLQHLRPREYYSPVPHLFMVSTLQVWRHLLVWRCLGQVLLVGNLHGLQILVVDHVPESRGAGDYCWTNQRIVIQQLTEET